MTDELHDKIKKIKQSFRYKMNGVAAQSMREKGVEYKINWGINLFQLKEMAREYGKDYDLAIELWKEDIRECKILATLIMPAQHMDPDIVDIWMEQIHSQELVEMVSFNLFQYLDYAPVLAYRYIASDKDLYQMCGYMILARLFIKGQEPNERGINEFLDQVYTALQSENLGVRHAALVSVQKFADMDKEYRFLAEKALRTLNFY